MGFAPVAAKQEAEQMLDAADLNNDGVVDFSEFKAVWHRKLLSQHDQYIHRVFAVFDDNGDGYIDKDELQGVLGEDFGAIKDMIAEVDDDKDNKISFEEFSKAMREDIENTSKLNNFQPGNGHAQKDDLVDEQVEMSPEDEEKGDY